MKSVFSFRFSVIFFFFSMVSAFAQQPTTVKKIEVTNYRFFEFDADYASDAQRFIGDVQFEHEGMTMDCDSAYMYDKSNTLDAFSRVHVTNADRSVTIDGDFAKYNGNRKLADIWQNVVLVDSNAILKTQHLYYELNTNIAYYLVGGQIFNKSNDMVSTRGHYHRNIDMFYFKGDVVLNTPDYVIYTDTLNYNVKTEIADFVGPTIIVNKENDTIYCERGWYNTNDTVALFHRNAWLKSGTTTVFADTLYYENQSGNGEAFGNISIVDTTNNVILKGHKGKFNNPNEWAWITKKALLILAGEEDSLFMHADTLRSHVDTTGFKIMRAYNKVRFFSIDMQGKCDSLAMSLQDSIIHMFKLPVLWAQDNQMTADKIEIETENEKPKRMNLNNRGFTVQEDAEGYNQLKGKKIVGHFRDGELYLVNGINDVETVYYLYDGPDIIGANKIKKSNGVRIIIEERKAQFITYTEDVDGDLIPPIEFDPDELTLSGFKWLNALKPIHKDDIYEWKEDESTQKETMQIKPDAPAALPRRNNVLTN